MPNIHPFHVIGMSPGNSYFKDKEVDYLLRAIITKYSQTGILIADVPAISTYIALGYSETRARRDKAIPKGNALKNRVRRIADQIGYKQDQVRIFEWTDEIAGNQDYQAQYSKITDLYDSSPAFRQAVHATTQDVLENSEKTFEDMHRAVEIASHYLLSELAVLEFLPAYLCVEKVSYVYHKNWTVYEDYITGKFDGKVKHHLDFLLLENPYETYNPMWISEAADEAEHYSDALDRVEKTKTLRVGFSPYPLAFLQDEQKMEYGGVFHDILTQVAQKNGWKVVLAEETGYGVIIDGLNEGRFDIFGSTVWPTRQRKEKAEFSLPLYESPVHIWMKASQILSVDELKKSTNLRIAIKENDITDSIAQEDFPLHRYVRVPQLACATEVLKFVAEGRADITFAEPLLAYRFNRNSSIKLEPLSTPIQNYGNCFMAKAGEKRLIDVINSEIQVLGYQKIQQMLTYYSKEEGELDTLHVAK